MQQDERTRVLDLWQVLRHTGTEEGLLAFGRQDGLALAAAHRLPFSAVFGLQQYARCKGWALYYRRQGRKDLARREASRAARQTRYFRAL
jgi:hypothetical protein